MSSPPQDPPNMEHHYQSSEASDHGLLSHAHTCTCCREVGPLEYSRLHGSNGRMFQCADRPESPKTDHHHPHCVPKSSPHHVMALGNSHLQTGHVHHNHQQRVPASPKTGNPGPKLAGTCTCHLKVESEGDDRPNIEQTPQARKLEEDRIEVSPLPPALPPRPPPRPRYDGSSSLNSRYRPQIVLNCKPDKESSLETPNCFNPASKQLHRLSTFWMRNLSPSRAGRSEKGRKYRLLEGKVASRRHRENEGQDGTLKPFKQPSAACRIASLIRSEQGRVPGKVDILKGQRRQKSELFGRKANVAEAIPGQDNENSDIRFAASEQAISRRFFPFGFRLDCVGRFAHPWQHESIISIIAKG
ncbi:hypothetical protein HUJ04_013293 [Dendroctonus ponderosae]|nr:hypothetical protein HUJ04_013293 [Dendroctonus ponderosae]